MNITLILSALVIGVAATNSPSASSQSVSPTSTLPLQSEQDNAALKHSHTTSSNPSEEQQHLKQQVKERASLSRSSMRNQQATKQNMQSAMPSIPTDSSAFGRSYQLLPPTENASSATGGGGSSGYMNVRNAPTRARPGTAQSYTSMQTVQQQNRRYTAARNATAVRPQGASRPFTGYRAPSTGASPYMNLFRNGNANGTIDNYSTLVRPELDQRGINQQFGSDIHGLENSTQVQGLNIRQLNRDTQSLQGIDARQYFMNYGDYYGTGK